MTLLESLVALVILGLAAVASLTVLLTSSTATSNAEAWGEAVARAESVMEQTKLGVGAGDAVFPNPSGSNGSNVTRRPRPELPGVDEVTVTISLPGGGSFILHRLVRAP